MCSPRPDDPAADVTAELSDLFDRTVNLYYDALDREDWSALWDCAEAIDRIHS